MHRGSYGRGEGGPVRQRPRPRRQASSASPEPPQTARDVLNSAWHCKCHKRAPRLSQGAFVDMSDDPPRTSGRP